MGKKTARIVFVCVLTFVLIACVKKFTSNNSQYNETLVIPTTESKKESLPTESLILTTDDTENSNKFSVNLQNKIFGKWKTKFYAWDRYGREEWAPMVLDNEIVTISMDEVDYLDYEIKDPKFYLRYYEIDEQATFHQFPTEITRFQKDILDITISDKDSSNYPAYYAIGFTIIGDIVFLAYQGAYFEITKID